MNKQTQVNPTEACTLAFNALTSVEELVCTLESYIYESGEVELEAKHSSVISALTEGIKHECKRTQGVVRLVAEN